MKTSKKLPVPADLELKKNRSPLPGRCNAQRQDGTFCKRFPIKGKTRCMRHGGKSLSGPQSPKWQGGRSKVWMRKNVPRRLLETFDKVVNDEELTSVRAFLGLVAARVNELLEKLPTKESAQAWFDLRDQLSILLTSDTLDAKVRAGLERSLAMTHEAIREHQIWDQVMESTETYRKLADTERRREEMLQSHLTAAQAVALFNHLFMLIAREVKDPETRQRVAHGLERMLISEKVAQAEPIQEA